MKCIVEVISDTLSKPNPLPISEECLETLRGGTASDWVLGISKSKSGNRGWSCPDQLSPGLWAPVKGSLTCSPSSSTGLYWSPGVGTEPLLVPGHASCWHVATSNCLVLIGPSCCFNHMVKLWEQIRPRERKEQMKEWHLGSVSFPGVGGRLLWLLSVLSLPCCRWANYFYPSPPKLTEGTSGNCCTRYSASVFFWDCNYREDCFLLL